MQKLDTYSNLIWCFDGVISPEECEQLVTHMSLLKCNNSVNIDGRMPWEDSDDLPFASVQDPEVKRLLETIRFRASQIVCQATKTFVYPNYTDLVLWRPGRSMHEHKDNGYTDDSNLRPRVWTSVCYLNDDYRGGVTFVKNERGEYYSSVPKQGRMVLFASDDRCTHGVTPVELNNRFTLSIWFATNPLALERS
jgi:hypothetical protein